jgi:hypothetical protein
VKSTLEAFSYPLRRENLGVMLLGVAILSVVYSILGLTYRGFWIELLFVSYYAIFLQSILHASMEGRETFPAWPEAQSPEEFFQDFFSIIAPFIVAFLPLLLLHGADEGLSAFAAPGLIFRFAVPSSATTTISAVLLLAGWLYLPMAILVWNFYGGWSILNPIAVAKAAWRTGSAYLFLVLQMAGLITAAWSVTLIPDPFITTFGASLLTFYALVVSMRLLGSFSRTHRATLGFERELPEPA